MPSPSSDIALNKAAIIGRCIARIKEEYAADPDLNNQTRVDALTLNVERACQAAIDLAYHTVAVRKLGMPQSSAETFVLLSRQGVIGEAVAKSMIAMTGFRNVAIHEYQAMDKRILRDIAQLHWRSLVDYCAELGLAVPLAEGR